MKQMNCRLSATPECCILLHCRLYTAYLLIYARTWLAANLGVFLKWMSTEFWWQSMAWAKHQVHKMSEARCHGVKSTSGQPSVCNPFFHQHEIQAGPTPQASLAKHVPRCSEQYSLFRTISQNLKLCEPLQTWADAHEIQLALLLDVSVGCIVYKHVWALFSRWRSGHDLWAFGHLCTVQLDSHRYLRWYQARWLNALFDEALPSCWGCLLRRGQTTREAMKKTGLWPCIPTSAPTSHTALILSCPMIDQHKFIKGSIDLVCQTLAFWVKGWNSLSRDQFVQKQPNKVWPVDTSSTYQL